MQPLGLSPSGKKNVHFKDEVEGNSLCDIVVIESYKKYYANGG